MAQEKIRFKFLGINIIEDEINSDLVKKYFNPDSSNKVKANVKVMLDVKPENDIINVFCAFEYKYEENVFAKIQIKNKFSVYNLKRYISDKGDNQLQIKNKTFLFFLIENSFAHLRAIQAIKMGNLSDEVSYIPYLSARKLVDKKQSTNESGEQK